MLQKVLVCLDGSKLSEQALPVVIEPCLLYKSEIILLQVVTSRITIPPLQTIHISSLMRSKEPDPFPVSDIAGDTTETLEPKVGAQLEGITHEQADAKEYLESVAQPLRGQGLKIKTAALQGEAEETILHFARLRKVTLIALTSRGLGGKKRGTLGSVAQTILKEAGIPVLLVKPK